MISVFVSLFAYLLVFVSLFAYLLICFNYIGFIETLR